MIISILKIQKFKFKIDRIQRFAANQTNRFGRNVRIPFCPEDI